MSGKTDWEYDVCISGGLGHVGLPLGLAFADAGRRVMLYDINEASREMVASGRMPFMEKGAEEVLRRVLGRTLFLSGDKAVVRKSRFLVVIIGTPVDEHLNPEYAVFRDFFAGIMDVIRPDHHIVLRSTVFPGTTERIRERLYAAGKQVRISFCPERIAEGRAIEEIRSLPQIVSSFDEASLAEVRELFSSLTPDIIALAPMEAELAKLFTNAWRYIQFAIANQFYQIATRQGLDFYRIYEAVTCRYPRASGFPGAGFAAGPCLFKDTMQLAAFDNHAFFLGHAAMLINEGLPNFLVRCLKERGALRGKTVGILGMAFKGDSDDPRESLSYKLKKILLLEAGEVLCTDPFVRDPGLVDLETVVARADILILGAPHARYRSLVLPADKVVVDVWNFWGKGGGF